MNTFMTGLTFCKRLLKIKKKKTIRKLSKLLREKMGCKMEKAKQAEKNVILVRLNIHKGEKLMATAQQICYRFGALISGAFPGTCC